MGEILFCMLWVGIVLGTFIFVNRYHVVQSVTGLMIWTLFCVAFSIVFRKTGFQLPNINDTVYFVFAISALLAQFANVQYFNNCYLIKSSDRKDAALIIPFLFEMVVNGTILPRLCACPVLLVGFSVGFVYLNAAIVVSLLLRILFLKLYWNEKVVLGNNILNIFTYLMHTLIVYVTGSVLFTMILQFVYALMWYSKIKKVEV